MIKNSHHPLVSVILPCYKMGRFIGEALESVGKQTYTNWEVIAVDDCGPEDGTRVAGESSLISKSKKCSRNAQQLGGFAKFLCNTIIH